MQSAQGATPHLGHALARLEIRAAQEGQPISRDLSDSATVGLMPDPDFPLLSDSDEPCETSAFAGRITASTFCESSSFTAFVLVRFATTRAASAPATGRPSAGKGNPHVQRGACSETTSPQWGHSLTSTPTLPQHNIVPLILSAIGCLAWASSERCRSLGAFRSGAAAPWLVASLARPWSVARWVRSFGTFGMIRVRRAPVARETARPLCRAMRA